MWYLDRDGFGDLLGLLVERGFELVGPTVRDGAIVLDRIDGPGDLPRGVREVHGPATYRLERTGDDRLFAWAHGPDSGKRFLFPPRELLSTSAMGNGSTVVEPAPLPQVRFAFIGLRACDLAAIEVQDRVFLIADPAYRARCESSVFVGVNCGTPGETCFCTSMGTGPRCTIGYDLALTELDDGGFTLEAGTPRGEELVAALGARQAAPGEERAALAVTERAAANMGRELDTADMPELLYRNRKHPRWDEVAARCLTCTNCTMVCPTCFCHDIVDSVSLSGDQAARTREWASCFTEEFTHTAGGDVRSSGRARYRQWLTHKFASWIDQFGTSGCDGCGRCITWCPVGIDVTEEIAAIRATDGEARLAEEARS